MNKNAEFLEGLSVKEARQKMVELLKEKELVTEEKQYSTKFQSARDQNTRLSLFH